MGSPEKTPRAAYPAGEKGNCFGRGKGLRSRSGFTLIEVLIAMAVLSVGLLGVATLFPVAYVNVDTGGKTPGGFNLASFSFNMYQIDATGTVLVPQSDTRLRIGATLGTPLAGTSYN